MSPFADPERWRADTFLRALAWWRRSVAGPLSIAPIPKLRAWFAIGDERHLGSFLRALFSRQIARIAP